MEKKRRRLTKAKIISLIFAVLFVLAAAALAVANIYFPVKYLSAYLFCGSDELEEGTADVTFVDVGLGECVIIRFPDGKNMLIDGGDGSYSNRLKIIKQLNRYDIDYIDYLVCSAINEEHCAGLAEIIKYKQVGVIYYPYFTNTFYSDEYRAFYLAACDSGAEMRISEYGAGESGDGWFFSFLSPSARTNESGEYAALNESATTDTVNAASAVLWVECLGTSFLFSGDATEDVFAKILSDYDMISSLGDAYAQVGLNSVNITNLDVILVTNHGGDGVYSSFYDYAKPDIAVVSVGENTRGLPYTDSLSTVCNTAEAYLTSESGTIKIAVDSVGYRVIKEK